MEEDAVVAGTVGEAEDIAGEAVVPRSGEEGAVIAQMFHGLGAGRLAFALQGEEAADNGLDRQPDPGEAWAVDSVPNNAQLRVRAEDPAADGPVAEAAEACQAWAVVGKDLLSVRISIALVLVQVLVRELVLAPVLVKARVLAFAPAKV